ncbi:MAG: SusC/RagA family TonB-linked outer membrane protein [Sphingobacteriales bacterium]|nr:SusC/RagA family TonB-linked outer membrane protein [Sphingobacteriales bacterium]
MLKTSNQNKSGKGKLLYILLAFLLVNSQLFAVNIKSLVPAYTVKGQVTSITGETLVGVSIKVKGTVRGTSTDVNGKFSISVPDNKSVLVFSYIGYKTQEVGVNGSETVNVKLEADATSLSEVVVVGYGTARKKDLTGSVTVITAKDFQKGNISTPEQMIAGKVPGVSITSNGGQPGSGSTIRIRGGSSLNASNDPLIVIDNVPLENSSVSGASNPLSFINPNDIESFTVLKDASAAAIYGARAANGVIIITTKKGKSDKLKVAFNTVNSLSEVSKQVSVLSPDEFRSIVNENGTAAQKAMLGTANTDWQSEVFQQALATDNNISISGGIKKLPYRLSLGYQNQDGILKTDNLQKTSMAFVLNPTFFKDHLKVDLNLKGSMQNARFGTQGAIGGAVSFDPTHPVSANSNRYNGYYEWTDANGNLTNLVGRNPVGLLNQRLDEGNPRRSIGNVQFDYKFHFLPELKANLNLGYDVSEGSGTVFVADSAASDYTRKGINNQYKQNKKNTLVDFYLNYAKEISSISRIDITTGYSYNDYLTTINNFADYNAAGVKLPNTDPAFPFDKPQNRLISFFGRANYTYNDRYLLTATLRRDGSSRFAENSRYALFPSVALAWTIKNESFLKNNKTVSGLKLRLGYGITGQQDGIGNYDYLSYYGLSTINATYQFGSKYYQMFRPGGYYADRKWEQTATENIGLDFGLFNDRITGSVDVYRKKTDDLLNKIPQPAGTNFSAYIVANVGSMKNEGIEFNINTQPIRKENFTWDAGFNVTYNKNTITNLTVVPNDPNYIGFPSGTIAGGIGGQFAFINSVGSPKNTFFLYQQVYDTNGKPIEGVFVDQNNDGIINSSDLHRSKGSDPKVFLGFSTNATYKKWNAGLVMRANLGNYLYNNVYSQTGNLSQILGTAVLYNASTNYLETNFKGGNAHQILSDYYLQNASFLRMDNINVGYKVGTIFNNKANLQLNANLQNVFIITKYSGLDPEIGSGVDNNIYPRPRVFSFGLNLNF